MIIMHFNSLGATQVKSMAIIVAKLDSMQNGFLDRFLISIPKPYRPLPDEQIEAKSNMTNYRFNLTDIYKYLENNLEENNPKEFCLDPESAR